jgi:hypothetical protein
MLDDMFQVDQIRNFFLKIQLNKWKETLPITLGSKFLPIPRYHGKNYISSQFKNVKIKPQHDQTIIYFLLEALFWEQKCSLESYFKSKSSLSWAFLQNAHRFFNILFPQKMSSIMGQKEYLEGREVGRGG